MGFVIFSPLIVFINNSHNTQAAELKLCPTLCAEAQTWANVLAHLNQFYHQNPPEVASSCTKLTYK